MIIIAVVCVIVVVIVLDLYGRVPFQLGEVPLVVFSRARSPISTLWGLLLFFDLYTICNLFVLLTKVSAAFELSAVCQLFLTSVEFTEFLKNRSMAS